MRFAFRLRNRTMGAFIVLCCLPLPGMAADAVLKWNEIGQHTVASANPLIQSRTMAILHLAIADAVTELGKNAPPPLANAAAIAAAHDVLTAFHPESAARLEAEAASGLSLIDEPAGKEKAIAIGRAAAVHILDSRKNDGWDVKASYVPAGGQGYWVPTPPAFAAPLGPNWGRVKPFALKSGSQYRPHPPQAFDSEQYRRELHEVFENGAVQSANRSAEMSRIAHFWTISAVQGWNPVARQIEAIKPQGPAGNAQTFALMNMAIADALIACFDAKYTYNSWRPVTAIRTGFKDVKPVADWLPLIATPPFPAYPSAHACGAGAALEILERLYGAGEHSIILTSSAVPGLTLTFSTFKAIADQIDDARVLGGIHTREDQEAGRELGRKVGRFVLAEHDSKTD